VVRSLVEDSEKQQRAKTHKRDRSWDAQRTKATYDIPTQLKDDIKDVAEAEGVPAYEIARLFLEFGLSQYKEGGLETLGAEKQTKTVDFTLFPE
jgi:hypothetical protein